MVEVELFPVLAGDRSLQREIERRFVLDWSLRPDGRIALSGGGRQLFVESDPELRYLLDRAFSWTRSDPINR